MEKIKLAIVGAGPKAISIGAKGYVLKQLGLLDIEIDIYEEHEVAANWDGSYGHTDGKQKLGTPPEKDIGFPYNSKFGADVDTELFRYSWESYLIDIGSYGNYIDRAKPHPLHGEWAEYLRWVAKKTSLNIINQRVLRVDLVQDEKFKVSSFLKGETIDDFYTGIVFTGPGKPLKVGSKGHKWAHGKIIDGQEFWTSLPLFKDLSDGRVAIIGAGETAASIAVALVNQAPKLDVEIINRSGTLYTRGESFHENELYTNPDLWTELDEVDREDFIRRTDRGVFSVEAKKSIDQASNIKTITGAVLGVERNGRMVIVELERRNQKREYEYDIVIVAIGFDPFWPLELLKDNIRPNFPTTNRTRRRGAVKGIQNLVDYHFRLPLPLSETGSYKNFHIPMISALKQGPGFPNLSCLGELSDRVLSTYRDVDDEKDWHCLDTKS